MGVRRVILCPDLTVAQAVYDAAPAGLLSAPADSWPSASGQYHWIHDWPEGFVATAEGHGATVFDYTRGWKAERGWVDQLPPENA